MTRTQETRTGQWGWTEAGQLWCTTCTGTTEVTCTHASGRTDEDGWCWDCDNAGRMTCPTCQR